MSGEWADQPAADNHGIPGKTLAAAREAMGWSVEQIADQLKMAVRQVIALEAGDYASLPGPAVVRGFVRAYAKVVRLDPAPLVAQIALDAPEAGISGSIRRDARPASFSQSRYPSHGRRSKVPVVPILIAVLVAAAGVAAWQFGLVPNSLTGSTAPAGDNAIVTETVPVTAPTEPVMQDPSVPLISVPPPANGTTPAAPASGATGPVQGVGTPPAGAPAPATTPAAAPGAATTPAADAAAIAAPAAANALAPAAVAGPNALVVDVREDSWVEVRDAKGKALMRRMVKAGETANVEIAGPSILIVGKPGAVTATLRGAAVALPPMKGSTISRVKVQ